MSAKDIQFEWDEDKNTKNIFKHGIDFLDAVYIWNDPIRQERYDYLCNAPLGLKPSDGWFETTFWIAQQQFHGP